MDLDQVLEGRRFSSVAIVHPSLSAFDTLPSGLKASKEFQVETSFRVGQWHVDKVQFTADRNYFRTVPSNDLSVTGGYRQDLYLAQGQLKVAGMATAALFVLAPYVKLLDSFVRMLQSRLGTPSVAYVVADMNDAFEHFEARVYDWLLVTRISVRDDQEPGLDLVSLTGRNPLRSNLREELKRVGPAYSMRFATAVTGFPTNVHVDRFGNYWWYQRNEDAIVNSMAVIDELSACGLLQIVHTLPTRRRSSSDE
jgi:hypothetical protein